MRNSTKPSKPESVSPCGTEMCVDDVSESEDLGHSAQPSASCGTDGEKGGESGVRSPKKMQDPRVPTQAEVDEHNMTHLPYRSWCASAGAERLTRTTNLERRSAMSQRRIWTIASWARLTRRPSPSLS